MDCRVACWGMVCMHSGGGKNSRRVKESDVYQGELTMGASCVVQRMEVRVVLCIDSILGYQLLGNIQLYVGVLYICWMSGK